MLQSILDRYGYKQIFTGWSGAETYYLPGLNAYLKIAPKESLANLGREREVLEWLEGKLPVPKVIDFEETESKQFILISEIEGIVTSEYVAAICNDRKLIEDFVKKAAAAIKAVHELPIHDCPFRQDIDAKLTIANENITRCLVDETDFDEHNLGRTSKEIYEELVKIKPSTEDLVFTHGDLCLPNIMIARHQISGFIDFDRGGAADRYHDLALFLRSFANNLETSRNIDEVFCGAYGINSLNHEKINYFRQMDELF